MTQYKLKKVFFFFFFEKQLKKGFGHTREEGIVHVS